MGPGSHALVATIIAAAVASWGGDVVTTSLASRAMQPGELVIVTISAAQNPPRSSRVHVRAFDHEVPAFPDGNNGWKALIGIDLDVKPGTYPITAWVGEDKSVRDVVVVPKTFRTRRLTVDPNFVTPPASEAARIEQEARLLEQTWASSATSRQWTTFSAPVPQPANSAFGTRSVFNGQRRNAHGGADFLSPAGTPVSAPSAGRVAIARNLYFSGNTIVIDHGLGVFSMLAHLSSIDVTEGARISARQVVGRVGATGRVTGPHLHWAVRVAGARIDPLAVLALLSGE